MITTIINARIFDGEQLIQDQTVVIDGDQISAVGGPVPAGSTIIDARGATLLPGLIDAHVHTSVDGLRAALTFGVTTELEMQGSWTSAGREQLAGRDDIADVRSSGLAITAPDGHPHELFPGDGPPPGVSAEDIERHAHEPQAVSTPPEAVAFVDRQVANGADYIKIMIEEGTVLGAPGLPMPSQDIIVAAVEAAHRHGKMAIAHVLTASTSLQAVDAGMNGLAHVFMDVPHTPEIVAAIVASGVFVTPCLCLNSSIIGNTGAELAADPRVSSRLSPEWMGTLCGSFAKYPQGNLDEVMATVLALHRAGVDILVGTDVSVPLPFLGGLAHGASVHHELQLLVKAGLTPVEALRAATSVPARRFGLTDRGRIIAGARADLLLVEGDPTTTISDTLSIRDVWRRGVRLASRS
ncbi:amidohydrolase family protein [Deinococcus sp. Arct2-2]|uniref:amidohydrolase family protein n=1 Tax=Deinococcus sp. Arct2-2 TaxID=2568653 RepID=UPI0010A59FF5|nr:amidohydrolase family protein [Deinococcus sp. Arct2-2]THF68545.1 amidohydrolase family protein [Deinococcus sp. Arct2-2]